MMYYKQQTDWTCGPAVWRMILAEQGILVPEDQLVIQLETTEEQGTHSAMFTKLAKQYNLLFIELTDATLQDIQALHPEWTIAIGYRMINVKEGHYALIRDVTDSSVVLADPYKGGDISFTHDEFSLRWQLGFTDENKVNWLFAVRKREFSQYPA